MVGKEIRVRSLRDPSNYYTISYVAKDDTIQPKTCSCASYQNSHDRCKHLFLVERYMEVVPKDGPDPSSVEGSISGVPTEMAVQDLRSSGNGASHLAAASVADPMVASAAGIFEAWTTDTPRAGEMQSQIPMEVQSEEEDDSHDIPFIANSGDVQVSFDRIGVPCSPPPSYVADRELRYFREGQAIQETWNDLTGTLHGMSISSKLAERHGQERMRNMVAQLQAMISTWQEAIGQKQPGAAQRR
jgi:hypothetical protein